MFKLGIQQWFYKDHHREREREIMRRKAERGDVLNSWLWREKSLDIGKGKKIMLFLKQYF